MAVACLSSTSLGSVVSVWMLEVDIGSVGWPVEVVMIVGQELLGEVGSGTRRWPGSGPGERGERGRMSSLLDGAEMLICGSGGCWGSGCC